MDQVIETAIEVVQYIRSHEVEVRFRHRGLLPQRSGRPDPGLPGRERGGREPRGRRGYRGRGESPSGLRPRAAVAPGSGLRHRVPRSRRHRLRRCERVLRAGSGSDARRHLGARNRGAERHHAARGAGRPPLRRGSRGSARPLRPAASAARSRTTSPPWSRSTCRSTTTSPATRRSLTRRAFTPRRSSTIRRPTRFSIRPTSASTATSTWRTRLTGWNAIKSRAEQLRLDLSGPADQGDHGARQGVGRREAAESLGRGHAAARVPHGGVGAGRGRSSRVTEHGRPADTARTFAQKALARAAGEEGGRGRSDRRRAARTSCSATTTRRRSRRSGGSSARSGFPSRSGWRSLSTTPCRRRRSVTPGTMLKSEPSSPSRALPTSSRSVAASATRC